MLEIFKAVLVKHFLFFLPLVIFSGTRPPLIKLYYVCARYYCNKNWHKNYYWLQRKDLIFRITKSFFFSAFLPGPKRWLTSSQIHMFLKIWTYKTKTIKKKKMQPISPSSLHIQIDTKKKSNIKICPSVNGYKLHLSKLYDSAFYKTRRGLLSWLSGKESACQWRRHGFDP